MVPSTDLNMLARLRSFQADGGALLWDGLELDMTEYVEAMSELQNFLDADPADGQCLLKNCMAKIDRSGPRQMSKVFAKLPARHTACAAFLRNAFWGGDHYTNDARSEFQLGNVKTKVWDRLFCQHLHAAKPAFQQVGRFA